MSSSQRTPRRYTEEEQAAVLARIGAGERQGDLARELGIPASTIRVWVRRAGASTSPVHAPSYDDLIAHNQALRAALSRTEQEVDLLKKASAYSVTLGRVLTVADKARLVAEYAGPLSRSGCCALLGIHPSTVSRHQHRTPPPVPAKWTRERAAIRAHHAATQGRCGRRDMHPWLRQQGFRISYGKTHDLMQQEGLRARRGSRRGRSPKAQGINDHAVAIRNLLWSDGTPCDFSSPAPGRRLVGDSTPLLWERRGLSLHLHVVLDLYHRAVVGWAVSTRPDALSAMAAMAMAHTRGALQPGTIFHSDHGSQYMANAFRDYCLTLGGQQSMGERRRCSDNAVAESFFATLKGDLPEIKQTFATTQDLALWLQAYIDGWYNRQRPHSWNDGHPPLRRPAASDLSHRCTNP